ncbi:MAG: hypothetical protein JXQ73_09170 [Phycisphaerae bacterium]|nr:hypothetical protein [Phycisphaerae bacterium]
MIQRKRETRLERMIGLTIMSVVAVAPGCGGPKIKSTEIPGPYAKPTLIAVAPALNFSGSSHFDPVQVADLFSSELTMVEGVQVVGVNRVMAVLSRQGIDEVSSPGHALEICQTIGCDGIVVFAVTEYDPYTPVVGMAAQLYMLTPGGIAARLDPVAASRQASPFPVEKAEDSPLVPRAQIQRVYNAAHNVVADAVRKFAEDRGAEDGALGWRKYLRSQRHYLRFCCWSAVNELMGQEYYRAMARTVVQE